MCNTEKSGKRSVELADVFHLHGKTYCQRHVLTPEQYKVMHAIQNCRTSILGGHLSQCDHCGAKQCSYNSCRNRHCPKCETFKAKKWLDDRQGELLPAPYFHVVFTLPHELNALVLYNKSILYSLLFQSAWETLKKLGKDPKRLDGEMGMLSILHTWGQSMSQHNHVHCIVPGGALSTTGKWKSSKKYLFPVKVMSKIFRGIYVSRLRAIYNDKKLTLPKQLAPASFNTLLDTVMKKDWVVYAKAPFAGPEQLLSYLGRYTHKIALSNHRIVACDSDSVTFKWRDYADNNKMKILRLKPEEFIRRFLSHVLPKGFMRIRCYGFLGNACKRKKVKIIQAQLSYQPAVRKEKRDVESLMLELTGKDITQCPICKQGTLKPSLSIPAKFGQVLFDTS